MQNNNSGDSENPSWVDIVKAYQTGKADEATLQAYQTGKSGQEAATQAYQTGKLTPKQLLDYQRGKGFTPGK